MDEKQLSLLDDYEEADNGPVVCLGMTFKNDEERREYFRNELRKKLPELKKIEGFPIGDDEDIIALSDPPYYTACPNPWINDFIEEWEREKKEKYGRDENEEYHREPFAADVSEGKNDSVYNAHSYHTKVPYKAIMRYILHYTKPGDIVLDGFSGTGMTGVAARRCGNKKFIEDLGFSVQDDNVIDKDGNIISKIGERKSILNDLSPAASLIAYNYNSIPNVDRFIKEAEKILQKVKEECSWMYQTNHQDSTFKGIINNIVWSDVFICPNCTNEIIYWDIAVDKVNKKVLSKYSCNHCGINLERRSLERAYETNYDPFIQKTVYQKKEVPVLITYTTNNGNYEKTPSEGDYELLKQIENMEIPYWIPTNLYMNKGEKWGDTWRAGIHFGITNVHHFFTKRNLITLATFLHYARESKFFNHLT